MFSVDLGGTMTFSDDGPAKNVFYDSASLKAQVMCLRAGQVIPPCTMSNDVLFCVLRGEGEMIVDDERSRLKPLMSVVVPRQAGSRSIVAATDLVILAVQSVSVR